MERGSDVRSYRQLIVWQKAMDAVVATYKLSSGFPASEKYGLTSQMQRAAVSIPANLAEGHARDSTKEFIHHVSIALGSLAELETHLELALRLTYVNAPDHQSLMSQLEKIGRMLRGLQTSLKTKLKATKYSSTSY